MKILSIQWPIVLTATAVLYLLTILFLPFNQTMATIFLFAIIGFWSRLPGVGIQHPFFILYQADVIDIFTLMIAIHVSPLHAIGYTVFCNLSSRAAGIYPPWIGVFKDAAIQSVIALIAPLLYALSGNSILTVVAIYSVLRIIGFVILHIIFPQQPIPQMLVSEAGAAVAVFLINMFYTKLFGSFFESLLLKGVEFNLLLFFIVTAVLVFIAIVFFGFSPKKVGEKVVKNIVKKAAFEKKEVFTNDDLDDFRQIRDNI